MKFRYYITDLFDGEVKGTNDLSVAEKFSYGEEWYVIDSETGEWLIDGKREAIKAIMSSE